MKPSEHKIDDLIRLFRDCFLDTTNTVLVRGQGEPIYLPAAGDVPHHQILFAHGFFASALHEIAHWTIAGSERRLLTDYGYWYKPDGRNSKEQNDFLQVESKPQAIEWILSDACQFPFHLSLDNLKGEEGDSERFGELVFLQKQRYLAGALPPRAAIFQRALSSFYLK